MGVLEKAMSLLNLVSATPAPMTFTELLGAASLPKATLHRILATLTREGLLRRDAYTKTFRLGFRLLQLAHEVWSDFDLRLAAQDEMVSLRNEIGHSVMLAVLDAHNVVLVAAEDAGKDMRLASQVGMVMPVHASAAGKVIAAYLDSHRRLQLLESPQLKSFTDSTLSSVEALHSELDLTRARGYAVEYHERENGVVAIAAPIFDIEARPIGAVCITSSNRQMSLEQIHGFSSAVIGAARKISYNAGGQVMTIETKNAPKDPNGFEVECVAEVRALLGEGPTWSPRDGLLYWVDILTPAIHSLDVVTRINTEHKIGSMVSLAIPKATGGLLVATPGGLMTFDSESKRLALLCHPEADRPGNRYNDGKCDRMGRLWVGTLDMGTAANRGNLFRVDPDGSWKKMDTGFTIANGLGWSPDNKFMYFTDSARRTVYVYDFDLRQGTIANRRALVTLDASDGTPDGLTVDEEGCLWVAVWDAWRLSRFSPEGKELLRVKMPVPRPTSCCFGGTNLDTLYVTSASVRLNESTRLLAPQSGSVFAITIPGVRGLPDTMFSG